MKNHQPTAPFWGKLTKSLQIGKHLVPYTRLFTRPTGHTFTLIISEMLRMRTPNSTDLAYGTSKSISGLSYFFNAAKWDHHRLERTRKIVVQNAKQTRTSENDIICLDATAISKTGKTFPVLGPIFDTSDKRIKDGYYFFTATLTNFQRSRSVVADWMLVSPHAPHFKSLWINWLRILRRIFTYSKAKWVVMDAGFRNQYLLKFILQQKRYFVIRVLGEMTITTPDVSLKLHHLKKFPVHHLQVNGTRLDIRIARGVMKAWSREIQEELTILMIQRSGFRRPLILVTNQRIPTIKEAVEVYRIYCRRWSIETLFKELKMEFGLEKFKVRKMVAILRYLTLVILAHTILVLKLNRLIVQPEILSFLQSLLVRLRKVGRLLIVSLKKLYEMLPSPLFRSKNKPSLTYQLIPSKPW